MLNKIKYHSVPVLFLFAVSWVFSLSMLFFPYSTETFGHDAGIFAYIGYAITQGKPIYIGAWDNKGPLLYLIDALGIAINYRCGIYILELLSLFVTLLFIYKCALHFVPRYVAAIDAALVAMPLTITMEGGNLSEEWALPFTTIALYLIVKFFLNDYRLKKYEMMIVGACIAAIVLLRLNIITFIAVAVLGVIIKLIKEKQVPTLLNVALFAFIGFLIFVSPIAIYLIATGSLSACLDAAYLGAVGAFTKLETMDVIYNITTMILNLRDSGALIIIVLFVALLPFCLYKTKGKKDSFKTVLLIYYFGVFATIAANSISGAPYMHYFTSLVPVIIIPVIWFSKNIYSFLCENRAKSFASTAVIAALALAISVNSIVVLRNNIFSNLRDSADNYLNSQYIKIAEYVKANSSPDDTVMLIGDGTAATSYYRAKRIAASNRFYYANGQFTEESKRQFANEIFEDLKQNYPAIILFTNSDRMQDFVQHLDNPDDFNKFLDTNYVIDENDFSNITYLYVGE